MNRSYFSVFRWSRREINTGTWKGLGLLEDASATQLSVSRVYSATSLIILLKGPRALAAVAAAAAESVLVPFVWM